MSSSMTCPSLDLRRYFLSQMSMDAGCGPISAAFAALNSVDLRWASVIVLLPPERKWESAE